MLERQVLIKAMRDSNIPKFLADDLPLFNALVQDLFPEYQVKAQDYGILEVQIKESLIEMGLQVVDEFVVKIIQLFDTFEV
jgi:dynein heavy chain, axonemal